MARILDFVCITDLGRSAEVWGRCWAVEGVFVAVADGSTYSHILACDLFDEANNAMPELRVFDFTAKALVRESPSEVARKSET